MYRQTVLVWQRVDVNSTLNIQIGEALDFFTCTCTVAAFNHTYLNLLASHKQTELKVTRAMHVFICL